MEINEARRIIHCPQGHQGRLLAFVPVDLGLVIHDSQTDRSVNDDA
jgi:hypothetical protein